jgi:hypothetical protein
MEMNNHMMLEVLMREKERNTEKKNENDRLKEFMNRHFQRGFMVKNHKTYYFTVYWQPKLPVIIISREYDPLLCITTPHPIIGVRILQQRDRYNPNTIFQMIFVSTRAPDGRCIYTTYNMMGEIERRF